MGLEGVRVWCASCRRASLRERLRCRARAGWNATAVWRAAQDLAARRGRVHSPIDDRPVVLVLVELDVAAGCRWVLQ
eukprot:2204143-Pyramimonas_sp.AAC.1